MLDVGRDDRSSFGLTLALASAWTSAACPRCRLSRSASCSPNADLLWRARQARPRARGRRLTVDARAATTDSTCGVCGNMSTGRRAHAARSRTPRRSRFDVARERRRVARDVDDARRAELAEPLQRLAGEAGARRVDDDDVRVAGALAQLARAPGRRCRRRTPRSPIAVQLGVLDRARDRLLGDLDPPHRQRVARRARGRSCRCRSRGRRRSRRRSARRPRARARRAARPCACSSAGTRSGGRGSAGRRAPPRSPPRPRAARVGRFVTSAGVSLTAQWIDRTSGNARQHLDQPLAVEALALVRSRAGRAPGRCCAPSRTTRWRR